MLLSKITPRSVSSPPAEAGEHKRPRLTAAAAVKENEFICVTPAVNPQPAFICSRQRKTHARDQRGARWLLARGERALLALKGVDRAPVFRF
jgi:hypothetical protein